MSNITVKRSKGPLVDPALCRCCHSIKKCRLLTSEYEFMGAKEVYSDMFMDIFGLLLSHLDGDNTECGICATCVCRLREAADFRKQVLQSEQMFLELSHLDGDNTECGICATCVCRLREAADFRKQVLQSEQMFLEARLRDNDRNVKLEVKTEAACDSDARDAADDAADRNDDSEMDSQMDETTKVEDVNNAQKSMKSTRNGHKLKVKEHLRTGKMQNLHRRLGKMLKPESPAEKSQAKKQADALDQNRMALSNTVTIVNCSYVCPFHNRISFYYCFYCKDQFTNPSELRDHTLSHDPTELFENSIENKKIPKIDITRIDCRLCPERIDDLDTFKNHITAQHQKVLYPVANEFLKFKLTLNNLTCTECGAVFPYFDSLKKHMVDHFGTYTCDVCGACFLEHASLRTHIKSHNKVDANFPCEICGKNLKSKYSMGLHVATVHEKKPTVNCYKCDAAFLSYALRNRHLIEAHGDKRTFPCKLCDKVYNRRKTLIEHHRRNHLKVFNHQCELCDQRFYLPSRLKEHMATHTGERNFRCEFCDKSYPRLQSLQEHVRSHSSDRRYKCDMCNTTFAQSGSLKSHMKNHHNVFDLDVSEGF